MGRRTTESQPVVNQTSLRTLALPFLAAVGIVAFALPNDRYPYIPWLLGLTFAPLVFLPNSRVWILAPVLIGELTLGSYMVPELGMSLRLATALVGVILALPLILRRSRFSGPFFRRVVLPAVALVMIATLVNNQFSESDYVVKYFRFQVVQVLGLLIATAVISDRRDLKRLALVVLAVGLLGAVAASWQHFATQSAIYGDGSPASVKEWKGRSIGLASSPVSLANQLTFVLVPVLGVLLAGPWRRDRARTLLLGAGVIAFVGINFTYTRSAFFALGPGILLIGLFLGGGRRKLIFAALLGAFVLFNLLEGTGLIGDRYYKDASEDRSASSHEALWEVGLAVALDNATLGIGHEHFEEVSLEYIDVLNEQADDMGGSGSIGKQRPHNDWLSVWMSWGILALAVYVALFAGTLRNFAVAARNPDPLVRGLAVGLAGWLATYGVNSAYHNYMDSSTLLWLCAGLSVALARLTVPRTQLGAKYRSTISRVDWQVPRSYGGGYV